MRRRRRPPSRARTRINFGDIDVRCPECGGLVLVVAAHQVRQEGDIKIDGICRGLCDRYVYLRWDLSECFGELSRVPRFVRETQTSGVLSRMLDEALTRETVALLRAGAPSTMPVSRPASPAAPSTTGSPPDGSSLDGLPADRIALT